MSKIDVSIIIVHYKAKGELFACLDSIEKSKPKAAAEVIVVDNDEKKTIEAELKRKFPGVKYLKAGGNLGFGAGNNLGARQAKGKFLFFLNPDTKVLPQAVERLVDFLQKNKKTAMVAPLLLDTEGQPYSAQGARELNPISGMVALSFLNKLFPHNPISKNYWLTDWDKKRPQQVAVVPGSAFMIRKSVFDQVGGFDQSFFLYFEEMDLCQRVSQAGWLAFMEPGAKVVHLWGASTKKIDRELNKKFFVQSRFRYFRKHYGPLWAVVVEAFTRFSKWQAIVIGIIILFTYLWVILIKVS